MSAPAAAESAPVFSDATLDRFAREVAKYPDEQRQSAVMACLAIVQQERGWISTELEQAVADYLGMPAMAVHEVVTFYDMYNREPVGRYKINVCTNLPCQLRGGAQALAYLEQKLGIQDGQTSADGRFTLAHCECLGACADAPVVLVNDRTMCSYMDEQRLQQLLDGLQEAEGEAP